MPRGAHGERHLLTISRTCPPGYASHVQKSCHQSTLRKCPWHPKNDTKTNLGRPGSLPGASRPPAPCTSHTLSRETPRDPPKPRGCLREEGPGGTKRMSTCTVVTCGLPHNKARCLAGKSLKEKFTAASRAPETGGQREPGCWWSQNPPEQEEMGDGGAGQGRARRAAATEGLREETLERAPAR